MASLFVILHCRNIKYAMTSTCQYKY